MASGTLTDPRHQFEAMHAKLKQLHALLEMTYGGGAESFNDMSDNLRGNYLWACADMADECSKLASALGPVVYRAEANHA